MDHIIALIRGGKSSRANTVPACKQCNSRKKYLLPIEWDQYLLGIKKSSPPDEIDSGQPEQETVDIRTKGPEDYR